MEKLLKATSRKEFIVFLRLSGTASLIVGIVTAAMDKAFGGFTPIFWFLLAFAGFFGVLCFAAKAATVPARNSQELSSLQQ
jgi:hypothetical protein